MDNKDILAKRFISILESVNFGVLVESEERTIVLVNHRFLEMFNIPVEAEEFMKMDCETAAQTAKTYFIDEAAFMDSIHETLEKQETVLDQLLEMKDGRFLERDYYPVFIEGSYRGHAWLYKDVTEKHHLQQKLVSMATTDQLTGIANRHTFHDDLSRFISLAERHSRPLSLLMADVDNFKNINDSLGHHMGDIVLKKVAGVMDAARRTTDSIGRWGGEEFIMALPETTIHAAENVAERLRKSVEDIQLDGLDRKVTISIGIARFSAGDDDNSLTQKADEALYTAKKEGKNRVVLYSSE